MTMKDFKTALYEASLVAFGKVLAKYNVFAQGYILRDVGQEILAFLNQHGLQFEETGDLDDLFVLIKLFVENGFAESVDIQPIEQGFKYTWKHLYGVAAYKQLLDISDNPFLSCPLNLCLYYLADQRNKRLILKNKFFDLEHGTSESQYEVVDQNDLNEAGFDSLVLENARLYELAHQRETYYRQQAITDDLTGVSNRRYLFEEGTNVFVQSQQSNQPFSLLMLDIDHFKSVNDTYGHSTGDIAICTLVKTCQKSLRSQDLIGRIGGEEFVIVLPNTPLSGATDLAERLRRTIEGLVVETEDGFSFAMTISIGVTAYDATAKDFATLLSYADAALYQAKGLGRNRVVVLDATHRWETEG